MCIPSSNEYSSIFVFAYLLGWWTVSGRESREDGSLAEETTAGIWEKILSEVW